VKEAIFPFNKFQGVDPILGPEMKSTGEVMGVGDTFGEAFAKAVKGGGEPIATSGKAFISVRDADKDNVAELAKGLIEQGFELCATGGTCDVLEKAGISVERVNKVKEGRPHIVDMIKNDEISMVVNTTEGRKSIEDSAMIRRSALQHKVYCTTTLAGAFAALQGLQSGEEKTVRRLQDLHEGISA
jgi:carbamoyl-phosphate synthase large subunit